MLNMKIFQFFNEFICASSVTEFSKKQNKIKQTSASYDKHYCYRSFFSSFAVRLLFKDSLNLP